jgi:hypothetical protein
MVARRTGTFDCATKRYDESFQFVFGDRFNKYVQSVPRRSMHRNLGVV